MTYYAKQVFFHPRNSHDLRIQVETALEILELVMCNKSIATQGLHYIVNPKMFLPVFEKFSLGPKPTVFQVIHIHLT